MEPQTFEALRSLPSTLHNLRGQFSDDPNVIDRLHIDLLISNSNDVLALYCSAFQNQGTVVIEKRQELIRISCPSKIVIEYFQNSLGEFQAHISNAVEDMKVLEHIVHDVIEECNTNKIKQEYKIKWEEEKIWQISRDIVSLERQIDERKSAEQSNDAEAEKYLKNAADKEQKKTEAAKVGFIGGLAGAGLSLLLLPFSGGASALALVATYGTLGTSLIIANDLQKTAEKYRGYARDEREAAEKARENIADLVLRKMSGQTKIDQSQITIRKLQTTSDNLVKVRQCLLSSIRQMNIVEHHVQDLNSSALGATQHGINFEIIQQALSEDPQGLEGVAYDLMMELREKWALVESEIRSVIRRV